MKKLYPGVLFRGLLMTLAPFLFSTVALAQPLAINNSTTISAQAGVPFTETFTATGGTAPYLWAAWDSLPPGMSFSEYGVLSGTPTSTGTFSIRVTTSDVVSGIAAARLTLTVAPPNIVITGVPTTLHPGATGVPYPPLTFNATGGTPPYTFTMTSSPGVPAGWFFPTGLSMSSGGVLSGTPTGPGGNLEFQVTVTDNTTGSGAPYTSSASFNIGINPTLNFSMNNANMIYGGTVPTLTYSTSGLYSGDDSDVITPPVVTTTVTSATPVGQYRLSITRGVVKVYTANYTTSKYYGWLTVNPASLTVTADSQTMIYGDPLPNLTVSYSGFVNGENAFNLPAQPTATTTATTSSPPGSYPIVPSGGIDTNYTFNYKIGTLTIKKRRLTITADSTGSTYGSLLVPNNALSVTYSGLANVDTPDSLNGTLTLNNTAYAGAPAGKYTLTPSGLINPKYDIRYVPGPYTIKPAILIGTADNITMTYGSPVPTLSVTYTGFVNGDNVSSLTIPTTVATTTATSTSPVGPYPITPDTATSPNYTINYVPGTLTIDPATLTGTADNKSMIYGSPLPSPSVTYTGFVNGDNVSSLTIPAIVTTTTATSASPVGTYPITPDTAASPNYTINYVPGTLSITPAALNITATPQTKVYGDPDPALTYAVSGLANGDNASIFTGSLTRIPGQNVGTYPITQGTLGAGDNYTLSFIGGNLTITKAPQEITWTQNLTLGCDGATQLQLNATASSGLPVSYSSSDPAIATVTGDQLNLVQPGSATITASQPGDDNHFPATEVTNTATYQSASLVRQHWADVLVFDNTSDSYVQWQWYKNGTPVPGATQSYYSETSALNGQYYVDATDNNGSTIQSCPLTITAGGAIPGGITVYPNPANTGTAVTITCNYPASVLQGARIQIVDMSGKVWQQITTVQPSMKVIMPAMDGIYIISLLLSNGQKTSVNVLVNY